MKSTNHKNICAACGTHYAPSKFDETRCPVCLDDRQYLKPFGQKWTSYAKLKQNHTIKINQLREDLFELQLHPGFAIGQRAFLILSPHGNVLWDCLPFLDEPTVSFIQSKGALKAIAISHPHYYGLMNEWAKAFNCPVYLHEADKEWVMSEEEQIVYFREANKTILPGLDIVHVGGHFPGSTVLHYQPDSNKPSLFIGDTLYLSPDKKHISAMYSYPNIIPLSPKELFRVFGEMKKLEFDSLFGAFAWQNIPHNANLVLQESEKLYQKIYNEL